MIQDSSMRTYLIAKRSERKEVCNGPLSQANAGNVRIHTSPFGIRSTACPGGSDTFHSLPIIGVGAMQKAILGLSG